MYPHRAVDVLRSIQHMTRDPNVVVNVAVKAVDRSTRLSSAAAYEFVNILCETCRLYNLRVNMCDMVNLIVSIDPGILIDNLDLFHGVRDAAILSYCDDILKESFRKSTDEIGSLEQVTLFTNTDLCYSMWQVSKLRSLKPLLEQEDLKKTFTNEELEEIEGLCVKMAKGSNDEIETAILELSRLGPLAADDLSKITLPWVFLQKKTHLMRDILNLISDRTVFDNPNYPTTIVPPDNHSARHKISRIVRDHSIQKFKEFLRLEPVMGDTQFLEWLDRHLEALESLNLSSSQYFKILDNTQNLGVKRPGGGNYRSKPYTVDRIVAQLMEKEAWGVNDFVILANYTRSAELKKEIGARLFIKFNKEEHPRTSQFYERFVSSGAFKLDRRIMQALVEGGSKILLEKSLDSLIYYTLASSVDHSPERPTFSSSGSMKLLPPPLPRRLPDTRWISAIVRERITSIPTDTPHIAHLLKRCGDHFNVDDLVLECFTSLVNERKRIVKMATGVKLRKHRDALDGKTTILNLEISRLFGKVVGLMHRNESVEDTVKELMAEEEEFFSNLIGRCDSSELKMLMDDFGFTEVGEKTFPCIVGVRTLPYLQHLYERGNLSAYIPPGVRYDKHFMKGASESDRSACIEIAKKDFHHESLTRKGRRFLALHDPSGLLNLSMTVETAKDVLSNRRNWRIGEVMEKIIIWSGKRLEEECVWETYAQILERAWNALWTGDPDNDKYSIISEILKNVHRPGPLKCVISTLLQKIARKDIFERLYNIMMDNNQTHPDASRVILKVLIGHLPGLDRIQIQTVMERISDIGSKPHVMEALESLNQNRSVEDAVWTHVRRIAKSWCNDGDVVNGVRIIRQLLERGDVESSNMVLAEIENLLSGDGNVEFNAPILEFLLRNMMKAEEEWKIHFKHIARDCFEQYNPELENCIQCLSDSVQHSGKESWLLLLHEAFEMYFLPRNFMSEEHFKTVLIFALIFHIFSKGQTRWLTLLTIAGCVISYVKSLHFYSYMLTGSPHMIRNAFLLEKNGRTHTVVTLAENMFKNGNDHYVLFGIFMNEMEDEDETNDEHRILIDFLKSSSRFCNLIGIEYSMQILDLHFDGKEEVIAVLRKLHNHSRCYQVRTRSGFILKQDGYLK
jgi:hypothetical protein